MKRRAILLIIILFASINFLFAQEFKVEGTKIYDPSGQEFLAKGTNVTGQGALWNNTTIEDKEKILNCWKFNTIRIYTRLYRQSEVTMQDVYNVIDTYTAEKIVVMIDNHDKIGSYFEGDELEQVKDFYLQLAKKYRDNTYVWFDLINEPGGSVTDKDKWVHQYQEIIKVIRDDAGANNVIVVEGGAWGQDAPDRGSGDVPENQSSILRWGDLVKSFNGKVYDNIVMSIHVYDQYKNGTEDRLRNYVHAIWAKGHALVIGEWGNENNSDVSSAMRAVAGILDDTDVGRIVWHWEGGDGNKLTVNGGGRAINDCIHPTNLTELGEYVWNDNHAFRDTIAPAKVSGIVVSNISSMAAIVSWQATTDNNKVEGYSVYLDDVLVGTTSNLKFNLSNLIAEKTYTVSISAFDPKNNESEKSSVTFKTATGDSEKPTMPGDFKSKRIKPTEVSFVWKASTDNEGIKGYNLYESGMLVTNDSSNYATIVNLEPSTIYSFSLEAVDLSGNTSELAGPLVIETMAIADFRVVNDNTRGSDKYELNFDDSWLYLNNQSGKYENDEHYSRTVDGILSFNFDGTKIYYFGTTDKFNGTALLQLDTNSPETISFYSLEKQEQALVWESPELENGNHQIVLTNLERKVINIDKFEIECEGCNVSTNINLMSNSSVDVYPTVVKNIIHVDIINDDKMPFRNVKILTILGQEILHTDISSNHNSIFISNLEPGLYLIQVSTNEKSLVRRFIKM